jgi:hypothetical protein
VRAEVHATRSTTAAITSRAHGEDDDRESMIELGHKPRGPKRHEHSREG